MDERKVVIRGEGGRELVGRWHGSMLVFDVPLTPDELEMAERLLTASPAPDKRGG